MTSQRHRPDAGGGSGSTVSTGHAALVSAAIANMIDGVVVIDAAGFVELFNSAAERCFGYSASEVIGRNVNMLMPEPYRAEHDGYIDNYLKTGQAKIIGIGREAVGRRKDGSEFPMELSVSELSLGEKRSFLGTVRDISERVEAQRTIEAQRRSLLELSTPVINVWKGIVMMPIIGVIDTTRAKQITEALLDGIVASSATVAILDITGVSVMDTSVAQHLLKTVTAARMLGSEIILTGISPETAQTVVKLGIDLSHVTTRGTLSTGLAEAFIMCGQRVSSSPHA